MLAGKIYNPSDMYSVFKAVTIEKSFCKMCVTICGEFFLNEDGVAGYAN